MPQNLSIIASKKVQLPPGVIGIAYNHNGRPLLVMDSANATAMMLEWLFDPMTDLDEDMVFDCQNENVYGATHVYPTLDPLTIQKYMILEDHCTHSGERLIDYLIQVATLARRSTFRFKLGNNPHTYIHHAAKKNGLIRLRSYLYTESQWLNFPEFNINVTHHMQAMLRNLFH